MSNTNTPLVSVIMSVYNGEKYINRALLSIIAQTFVDFEVIIIDDGSTDSTPELIHSILDDRIILVRQDNCGLTKSLNRALRMSRGKWIARHDADDFSISTRFEKQITYLENHLDVGMLGSSCFIQPERHGIVNEIYDYPESYLEIVAAFTTYNPFVHGSMIIDKNLLLEHGGYNENYRYVQDYELWSRLLCITTANNLSTPLYVRSVHKETSQNMIDKEPIFNEIRDNYVKTQKPFGVGNSDPIRQIQSISVYPGVTNSLNKSLAETYYNMSRLSKSLKLPWIKMRINSVMYHPW